jgi:hypothetical protein
MGSRVGWSGTEYEQVAEFCKHDYEFLDVKKGDTLVE